ncbi:MAG: Asp23/Gls24 family envelope stress response protein [Oscillospiraceae bacterium]|nr:Asp23/Gls24 family envelope stress response protein [Oscillospiraceae bacterium]
MRHENENGSVNVSTSVYTDIVGTAVINCFGVKGMAARSLSDGLYHLLRRESVGKGVHVQFNEDDTISIDLHIIVDNNVNLNAVGASIISEVRYVVTNCTGTEVRAVNVYIDSMVIG